MAIKENKPWRQTPLVESTALSKAAGCRIFLKLEHLQPGGSFKSRGIGKLILNSMRRASNPDDVHFCSSSGGNAGLACCAASNFVGRPCTVMVPMATSPEMVEKIKLAGASQVIQYGASWAEADGYLKEVVIPDYESRGSECVYIPPFDHPDIWEGHSTLVDELRQQFAELCEDAPDVIACSVGGGGLFCGIMEGLERQGGPWNSTQVVGVETNGAESLANCLKANEMITLPSITSQAVTLGCRRVAQRTFELASKHRDSGRFKNAVFPDTDAEMGCVRLADTERVLVELACGVTISLCFDGRLKQVLGRSVHPDEKVVIVVCGGQGVNTGMIERWRTEHALSAATATAINEHASKEHNVTADHGHIDSGYTSEDFEVKASDDAEGNGHTIAA